MDYERKEEYQYIPITPYYTGLEEQGIRVLENKTFDLPLKKLDWPRLPGYRTPRGGSDDNFHMELLKFTWKYQQLHIETPHRTYFDRPSFIATRLSHDELCFHGVFLTRMAGDVAVVPMSHNIDYLMLFIDTSEEQQQYRAVRFNRGSTLIIDAFVPHSFPIPIMGQHETFQMEVYHRALDDHIIIPTQEPLCIQLSNINKTKIHSLKILPSGFTNPEPVLPPDFANKKLTIEHSSQFKRFSPYGDLIEHWDCHHEKAQPLQWPGTEASDFHNNLGSLEQEFRLTWIPKASSSKQKLYFEGLHDSYNYMNDMDAGIEYIPEKDEYSIHLISTRPDGTYYIHALKPETTFIMAFALPNPENGEPIKETLKAFYFHGDEAIHLHAGVWHSLPILEYRPNGSAEFKEIVCETNAHVDINIPFECGHSLKFTI